MTKIETTNPPKDHSFELCRGEQCTCPCYECREARSFESAIERKGYKFNGTMLKEPKHEV